MENQKLSRDMTVVEQEM